MSSRGRPGGGVSERHRGIPAVSDLSCCDGPSGHDHSIARSGLDAFARDRRLFGNAARLGARPFRSISVIALAVSRLLVEFGAAVTATAGVAEALEAFERERPDVVLSDIGMGDPYA